MVEELAGQNIYNKIWPIPQISSHKYENDINTNMKKYIETVHMGSSAQDGENEQNLS